NYAALRGTGTNGRIHPPPGDGKTGSRAPAWGALGAATTQEHFFPRLSATMCRRIAQWDRGRGFPVIVDNWLSHTRGIGEPISVRNGEVEMRGRFVGLDQSGRLMLEVGDGGIKTISAGEVFPFFGKRAMWPQAPPCP